MEDVVARARAGDRDALAALWRGHQHLLLRYFRGRGATQPDDLASQVWIDVAGSLHRFEGDGDDFRRWLFTIARRRLIDERRRQDRRPVDLDPDAGVPTADPRTAGEFDAADDLERALRLVRSLPADMAEAVLLRVVADLDVAQVAVVMGRREGHVRVLTHRGLTRLRERLVDTQRVESTTQREIPVTQSVGPTINPTS